MMKQISVSIFKIRIRNFRDQNDPGMSWLDFELFLLQVLKINFCRKELNEKNIFLAASES